MRVFFTVVIAIGWLSVASAATITWTNSTGTNIWHSAGNWDTGIPANDDDVVITNSGAYVLLTNSTANLASLTLGGATLIFTNWTTVMTAATVNIQADGIMTSAGPITNTVMSNRVNIVCSNLTIDADGSINVDNKGYDCGQGGATTGHGSGGGRPEIGAAWGGGGGSYGGMGGHYGTNMYGSANAPEYVGSGGGVHIADDGGAGGGAVRINASGAVQVNGLISANGANAKDIGSDRSGGGSGGGIYITCNTFVGTNTASSNGVIRADGGSSAGTGYGKGNGGGGGRVAVVYGAAQSSVTVPSVRFSVIGGDGSMYGDIGTLYFPNNLLLTDTLPYNGQLVGFTNWSPNNLVISNVWVRFIAEGLQLNVANDVTIMGSTGRLDIGGAQGVEDVTTKRWFYNLGTGPTFTCGGNLTLTNGGSLWVYVGLTNAVMPDYGALVQVAGDVFVASGCWIYPGFNPTNQEYGSALFRMMNLTIQTGAGFNADSAGYASGPFGVNAVGYGPGGGKARNTGGNNWTGGGSYGGWGGCSSNNVYGSVSAPIEPGSGGGTYSAASGGAGGGSVRIWADGCVSNNGIITANGEDGEGQSAGGSGGGIYIRCGTFAGDYSSTTNSTNGVISASGGASSTSAGGDGGGGAGGGRIAIIYTNVSAQAALSKPSIRYFAAAGTGWRTGEVGTIYFTDNSLMTEMLPHIGRFSEVTNWSPGNLIISNGWVEFPAEGLQLNVTNDVTIIGSSARLILGGSTNGWLEPVTIYQQRRYYYNQATGPTLTCGGNLTLTNGGSLCVYVGPTNAVMPDYGALVNVTSNVYLETNTWVYPFSHPTNASYRSAYFLMKNLTIQTNAGFNANGKGYAGGIGTNRWGFGPGGGEPKSGWAAGGCYGGQGGFNVTNYTYGDSNTPFYPGSGAGRRLLTGYYGGDGGGLVRIRASGTITLNGIITVDGTNSSYSSWTAGGSGGGIYLYCLTFAGTNGFLHAEGAPTYSANQGGGGGGGRIAVWRAYDTYSGGLSSTVAGGPSSGAMATNGEVGSIVWMYYVPPVRGTFFWIN